MKCSSIVGLFLIVGSFADKLSTHSKVTPVQKVLEMLTNMKAESAKQKDAEKKTFNKYASWAKDQEREFGYEIKTAESKVEKLTASITTATVELASIEKSITHMESEIDRMTEETKDAKALRKTERDIFESTQQDLSESIEAIAKAQEVLEAGAQDKEQAAVLLESMATTVPKMPEVIAAFLQEDELGAPAAAAYTAQSGDVLSLLESLGKKFKEELDEIEPVERNKANAYELELEHLSNTIATTKIDLSKKTVQKGKKDAAKATDTAEKEATEKSLAASRADLTDTTTTLATKEAMFDSNQKTRTDEYDAFSKAIDILSSDDVSAGYKKRINLMQVTSFFQLRSAKSRVAARHQVSRFLRQRAAVLSSSTLKDFANQVRVSPFKKVTGLIEGLIAKLKEEASEEATHNTFCEEQVTENKASREKESQEAEALEAAIETQEGEIATLTKEINALVAEQMELTEAQTEALELRTEEKAENTATEADAKAGYAAVQKAYVVLTQFFENGASFVQQVPDMQAYKGSDTGVLGMLEVIESDFLRLEAETKADEASAEAAYNKFKTEADASKATKKTAQDAAEVTRDSATVQKTSDSKNLKLTNEALKEANKYYETLKPKCIEVNVSFEKRAERRKEEISALKEAYGILGEKSD